jgi:hypothetical protein
MAVAYVSVEVLKGSLVMPSTATANDTRLRVLAEGVSEQINRWTNRRFDPYIATFFFGGDASTSMLVPDLVSVASLKEDSNESGTFSSSWTSTDYVLLPFNADPTADYIQKPYTEIWVRKATGTQDVFQRGQRNYEIVGTWGYSYVTKTASGSVSASFNATTTTVNLDATAANFEVGWTIKIDNELMYVTSKASAGTSLTVTRGVNGSTAATHASGTAISYVLYPQPVIEACAMQAARIVKRFQSGFVNQLGLPETGEVAVFTPAAGLDADIRAMLAPYRRMAA